MELGLFFRWSCDIDIHMFLYRLLGTTYITILYYQYIVHNNLSVEYQLCLNKLLSLSLCFATLNSVQ